jgi:hypothetical protein
MAPIASIVVLLSLSQAPADVRDNEECLSFSVPYGWQRQPSKVGSNALLLSGSYLFGKLEMFDSFSLRIFPAEGGRLDAFKDMVIDALRKDSAPMLERKITRFYGEENDVEAMTFDVPKMTRILVSGVEAYRFEITLIVEVGNEPVRLRQHVLVALFHDTYYLVTGSYPLMREKEALARTRGMLASLKFDACKQTK